MDVMCVDGCVVVPLQVFPITTKIGLIGWVDNTAVLRTLVDDRAGNVGEIANVTAAKRVHEQWISNAGYGKLYADKSASDLQRQWKTLLGSIPSPFYLRDALMGMASCAQACIMLREQFARSLATLSVSQYVLGIGDRHRSNTLVDTVCSLRWHACSDGVECPW